MRNRLYELYDGGTDMTDDIHADNDPFPADPLMYGTDLNNTTNYRYDPLGNLVHDTREEIDNISWTVAGKVKSVERSSTSTLPPLEFHYGAGGQRTMKQVADPDDALDENGYREYYIRDAQGNVMATYRYTNSNSASFRLTERPIYGSSRLGVYARTKQMHGMDLTLVPTTLPTGGTEPMHAGTTHYELTDHLGNVSAVVTGQLLPGGTASAWQPKLLSAQGYEPFGSLLPGRNYSSDAYRFGFQGQEKDDEIHGATGTSYAFEYRIHDPRIGRFLSIDPLAAEYPHNSPYAFAENKLGLGVELEGLELGPLPAEVREFGYYVEQKLSNAASVTREVLAGAAEGTGNFLVGAWNFTLLVIGGEGASYAHALNGDLSNPLDEFRADWDKVNNGTPRQKSEVATRYALGLLTAWAGGEAAGVGRWSKAATVDATIVEASTAPIASTGSLTIVDASAMLRNVRTNKGNFGMGAATAEEAQVLGESWVGAGYKVASDGTTMVSADGLRQFRPPSAKASSHASTGVQANYEWRTEANGSWQGNGHLDVTNP